jgi:Mg2+/Co2+ transporter CorB
LIELRRGDLVSFLCSLLEATLLSLDSIHLETRKRQGHRYAAIWLGMKQRIDRPIAAILILNTVAHTGGATVAGGAFDKVYGDQWIWVFSLFFTIVILFATEIFPKVIGVSHNERLAPVLAPILAAITVGLRPAVGAYRVAIPAIQERRRKTAGQHHGSANIGRHGRSGTGYRR